MTDGSLINTGKGFGVVLVNRNDPIDPTLITQAGARLGMNITSTKPGFLTIDGTIGASISIMGSPHPDAMDMPRSPTAAKIETLQQMTGFYIIGVFGLPENNQIAADWYLSRIVTAIIRATPAIAALIDEGRFFYDADFFARAVESDLSQLATQIAVDITAASEPDGRMSLVTHGLNRYGYEEVMVLWPDLPSAIIYTMGLARDVVRSTVQLTPGAQHNGVDGRPLTLVSASSPVVGRPDLILIDDLAPPQQQQKKGLFGRKRG